MGGGLGPKRKEMDGWRSGSYVKRKEMDGRWSGF